MKLLTKRESDRIGEEMAKPTKIRDAAVPRLAKAKADHTAATIEGDGAAVVEAKQRIDAETAIIETQQQRIAELGRAFADAMNREEDEDFLRYCEALEKRAERRAKTLPSDFAKAFALARPLLAELTGDTAEHGEANKRRSALGLAPILTAEERARATPGCIEPAVFETRDVWRRPSDGATPSQLVRGRDGELRPVEAGYEKVRERVCVRQERHIAPQRPKPLAETVVIPGFAANDLPLWPVKGVR